MRGAHAHNIMQNTYTVKITVGAEQSFAKSCVCTFICKPHIVFVKRSLACLEEKYIDRDLVQSFALQKQNTRTRFWHNYVVQYIAYVFVYLFPRAQICMRTPNKQSKQGV